MATSASNSSRPRLSVAMIVRDEQDLLAASIESVRPIADEIVVLDTGSTDQTPAIAEGLGTVVGRTPWQDDFSAARNRCLEQVTGDWVLWLDAGERLDVESAAELREFVDRQADQAKVYLLLIQVPPRDQTGCSERVARLRLAPNRSGLRFEGRVRETLWPSIEAAGLQIDAAPGRIVRHPRQHDPARKAFCAQRDLNLAALETAEKDGSPPARVRLAVGEAYGNLGLQDKARQAFLKAIEAAEHGSTELLEAYYGLLTTYDGDQSLAEQQMTTCLEALEIFPLDAQLLLAMGNYLQARNCIDFAARSFQTAVKYGQVDPQTWHLDELAEVAAACLNLTLQMQKKDDEARRVLEEALRLNPSSNRLRRHLIDLHVKHGRSDEAVDLADQLAVQPGDRGPLLDAVRGACNAAQEQWTAALAYLQGSYVAGCRDPLCLRWLSVTLLANGQLEAAEPVLHEWLEIEPNNVEPQTYLAALKPPCEIAAADQGVSQQHPADDPAGRRFRIDQGTTVLEVAPPQFQIISQSSSADASAGNEG